ncbi:MAG: cupin domain-containing protein [Gammaproteobacteria bacterium]
MSVAAPLVFAEILDRVLEPDTLDWRPFRAGVEIFPIYGDMRDGPSAALLRYEPGARVPEHTHLGHEHVLVLSGSQCDAQGTYRAGTLVINRPGTSHAVQSVDGCVVLLIWERPVRFDA